jgi:hypothetical protein
MPGAGEWLKFEDYYVSMNNFDFADAFFLLTQKAIFAILLAT